MTTTPDPRPTLTAAPDGSWRLAGARCEQCGYPTLVHPPRCARCFGPLTAAAFGPSGTVWSSTVVRIPVPGRTPPYTLAYVDLDDGPRVLAHVTGATERIPVGTPLLLAGPDASGDLHMEVAR